MQRIEKVKQSSLLPSPSLHASRELSGWGTGIPNAAQVCQLFFLDCGFISVSHSFLVS